MMVRSTSRLQQSNCRNARQRRDGFTLFEAVIALGVVSIVVVGFTGMALTVFRFRNAVASITAVQSNGGTAFQVIAQRIREAAAVDVDASVFGVDPGVLVLRMSDPQLDPMTISLSSGHRMLQLRIGARQPIAITDDAVVIEALTFRNVAPSRSKPSILTQLTISSVAVGGRGASAYTKTFRTATTSRR